MNQAVKKFMENGMLSFLRICWLGPQNEDDLNIEDEYPFMEELSSKEITKLFKIKFKEEVIDSNPSYVLGRIIEKHKGKFVIQVQTPVMQNNCFSWGHTHLKWFLGRSIAEVIDQAIEWQKNKN